MFLKFLLRVLILICILCFYGFILSKVRASRSMTKTTKYVFYFFILFGGGLLLYTIAIFLFFGVNW